MRATGLLAIVIGMALSVAACDGAGGDGAKADGWSVQMRASGDDQVFLIAGPDGRQAAAQVSGGASSLMDATAAKAQFAGGPETPTPPLDSPDVSIKAPGFEMKVQEGETEDGGQVEMRLGGMNLSVNGADNQALVSIEGADARAARKFIDDADALSPEVKAALKEQVGL